MSTTVASEQQTPPEGGLRTDVFDLDSHEMVPMEMWPLLFGAASEPLIEITRDFLSTLGENSFMRPDLTGDHEPMTEHNVWNLKGPGAPGAIDMGRRVDVLRTMGIERQFVFPSWILAAISMLSNERGAPAMFGFDPTVVDFKTIARNAIGAHNAWATRVSRDLGDANIRPVGVVLTESVDAMVAQAGRLIGDGLRVVWIPSGTPPANTSPADRALDPFWALCAGADVPVVLHLATEFALISPRWHANVPAFGYGGSAEFAVEPFRGATLKLTCEAFLSAMILGGVFERHPTLRFGLIELGAQWVGPLAEHLDVYAAQFPSRLRATISMQPSQYLARNVRVTPFHFEPVQTYFERWPELSDVFCYSSDYPHREGGKESKRTFHKKLSDLGDDVIDRFFRRNASHLMPD